MKIWYYYNKIKNINKNFVETGTYKEIELKKHLMHVLKKFYKMNPLKNNKLKKRVIKKDDKIVVYSCVTKYYDALDKSLFSSLVKPEKNVKYILFTNMFKPGYIKAKYITWEIQPLFKKIKSSNVRTARWHKVNAHKLFPKSAYTVWIDGNLKIKDISIKKDLIEKYLENEDIATFKHPERNSINAEAKKCIVIKKDNPEIIMEQIKKYKKEKYPINGGKLVETTCLIRRMNPRTAKFNKAWWAEISKNSFRDQLSFNYVAWNLYIDYQIVKGCRINSPYFQYIYHYGRNTSYEQKIKKCNFEMYSYVLGLIGKNLKSKFPQIYYKLKPYFPDK